MTALFGSLFHGPVEEVLAPSTASPTDPGTARPKMVVDLCTGTGQWCVLSSHCLFLIAAHGNILRVARCYHHTQGDGHGQEISTRQVSRFRSRCVSSSHPISPFLFISVRRSCLPAFCFCFRRSLPPTTRTISHAPISRVIVPLFCQLLRFCFRRSVMIIENSSVGPSLMQMQMRASDVMARVRGLCAHSSRSPFILILICVSIWMAISIVHL